MRRIPNPLAVGSIPTGGALHEYGRETRFVNWHETCELNRDVERSGRQPRRRWAAPSFGRERPAANGMWGIGGPLGLGPSLSRFDSCHSDWCKMRRRGILHGNQMSQVRVLPRRSSSGSSVVERRYCSSVDLDLLHFLPLKPYGGAPLFQSGTSGFDSRQRLNASMRMAPATSFGEITPWPLLISKRSTSATRSSALLPANK